MCIRDSISPAGVLYCNICGLHETNAMFGHAKGDQIVRHCYDLIHDTLGVDLIYHTGGDEFVVLCPELSLIHI